MIDVSAYVLVMDAGRRTALRAEAAQYMRAARSDYATMCAIEAMLRLQIYYPGALAVEFRESEDSGELTVTIVKVFGPERRMLYVEDNNDFEYFDDQSEVGDLLVAALRADPEFFAGRQGRHIFAWPAP